MVVKTLLTVLTVFVIFNPFLKANYKVETFTLSNKIQVILSPSGDTDSACVLVYHRTGVKDDPPGLSGGTFLYQNLMLLGTRNLQPYERLVFIEKQGGISNRKIGYDNTVFYHVVPASELNNALWVESERIRFLNLTEREISLIKNSTYRRIYNRVHGNANVEANQWIKEQLFAGTIYQTPLYGDLEKIIGFDNQAIRELYNNFRNPADITLVISGNFDKKELKDYLDRHFAALPSGKERQVKKKANGDGPPASTLQNRNWIRKDIFQNFFMYGIKAPSKSNYNDHLHFNFIRYYLVDQRISRLERMMNQVNQLDVTIHSEYTNHFDANALIIKISSSNRGDLYNAKYILDEELKALMNKPLSQSEIKSVKALMEIDFRKDMAILEKRSLILAENFHLSGNLNANLINFERNYINRIKRIDSYDIVEIAKKFLKQANRVILHVYKQKD